MLALVCSAQLPGLVAVAAVFPEFIPDPANNRASEGMAETINGLNKAELIHRRAPWKTREALELATLEWVCWFNHHRRLLEPLGYIPPAEAEANYYRQLANQAETTA